MTETTPPGMRVPISEYPPNSKKSKVQKPSAEERPKNEKVVTGRVITKKKGFFQKVAETFTGDDVHSVGEYVVFEVVVPAAKSLLQDIVNEGIQRLLFGDVRGRARPTQYEANHISYNKFYGNDRAPRRELSRQARATHDFDDIILESRKDAEQVVELLANLVADYGQATVADLYDLVGQTGNFTDNKWGWYSLRDADVIQVRGGYLLNLPRPRPLD